MGERVSEKDENGIPLWVTWSLGRHTEDELREAYLSQSSLICTTYVCENSVMSEEFVKELVLLSTGLFDHDNYTEENRNLVSQIMIDEEKTKDRMDLQSQYDYLSQFTNDKKFIKKIMSLSTPIRSKVDWAKIITNPEIKLSDDFKNMFSKQLMKARVRTAEEKMANNDV